MQITDFAFQQLVRPSTLQIVKQLKERSASTIFVREPDVHKMDNVQLVSHARMVSAQVGHFGLMLFK